MFIEKSEVIKKQNEKMKTEFVEIVVLILSVLVCSGRRENILGFQHNASEDLTGIYSGNQPTHKFISPQTNYELYQLLAKPSQCLNFF